MQGTITPQGAKNEALEVICAAILTAEEVRISNVPDILDVNNLILLLADIGVKVTRHARNDYSFKADELNLDFLSSDEFVRKCAALRGSVLLIVAMIDSAQACLSCLVGRVIAWFTIFCISRPYSGSISRSRCVL